MSNSPSGLPGVVSEIVAAILSGDWTRYGDDSGRHFYYVIRRHDSDLHATREIECNNEYMLGPSEAGAFEDWYVRAALAEESPDRLAQLRKRIAAAGVNPEFLDAVIEASRAADSPNELQAVIKTWMHHFVQDDLDGLIALTEALRIDRTRQEQIFLRETDRPAIREMLEMRFLKELAERFPKVIKRAVGFDWLSFSDPQLREASRCYLYGFFRAAVLVAVSAVEDRLKTIAGVETVESKAALVDAAFGIAGAGGADSVTQMALKRVFKLRNRIAHEGVEPTATEAEEVLNVVRDTFEKLAPQDRDFA